MDTKGISYGGGSNEKTGTFSVSLQGLRYNAEGSELSDFLKHVPRLTPEEPKAILKFFMDIKAIYDLNLVPDNVFDEVVTERARQFVNLLWGVHKTWRFMGAM
jgi:hypothetical protein